MLQTSSSLRRRIRSKNGCVRRLVGRQCAVVKLGIPKFWSQGALRSDSIRVATLARLRGYISFHGAEQTTMLRYIAYQRHVQRATGLGPTMARHASTLVLKSKVG